MSKRIHTQSSLKAASRDVSLKRSFVAAEAPEGITRGVAPAKEEKRSKKVYKSPRSVYVFDATRSAPEVGDTLAVIHRTKANAKGAVIEVKSDCEHRKVAKVYLADSLGYSVQDDQGEAWLVRPATQGSDKWETMGHN